MTFDAQLQRKIMGCFATGVTVVTCEHDGKLHGMTANAVTSLSLDPPLVLVAVAKTAGFHATLTAARSFAMNMLSEAQQDLSNRFAQKGEKPFDDIPHTCGETGAPIFNEALAHVDCQLEEILAGGDHDIFIGRIVAGKAGEGRPLLYFNGQYRSLAE